MQISFNYADGSVVQNANNTNLVLKFKTKLNGLLALQLVIHNVDLDSSQFLSFNLATVDQGPENEYCSRD